MPAGGLKLKGLQKFELDLKQFGEVDVPEQSLALQKKIAIDLLTRIVFKNPVGNPDLWKNPPPPGYVGGRSRGGWQIRRQVTNQETGVIDPGGGVTIASGVSSLGKIKKPFGVIWIFNNVPYIVRLEEGWSTQAPNGMVALSLAEVQAGAPSIGQDIVI